MYKCLNCNESFHEPNYREEDILHSELSDGRRYETEVTERCPHCGSDDIEDRLTCEACGEEAVMNDSGCVCEYCAEEAWNKIEVMCSDLQDTFACGRNEALDIIGDWLEKQ